MAGVWPGILALGGACLALSVAGCGGVKTVPVKGIVTFDNKPLANASVIFITQEKGGRDATGTTDVHGAFQLSTFARKDGALPGLYKVTVHYSEAVAAPPNLRTAEAVQKALVKAGPLQKPGVVIPAIYSQPDRTVLEHRVPEDGDVRLELKSDAH